MTGRAATLSRRVAWIALLAVLVPGCPTIKIRGVEVTSFKKDVAQLTVTVEVDNSADDAGAASADIAIALPDGWVLEEMRYTIPGEPVTRRGRPSPQAAIEADHAYLHDGTWWGYATAEHAVPAGVSLYELALTVRVPRGTRQGTIALLIGDPGDDAEIGAYALTLKPSAAVSPLPPPAPNPDRAVSDPTGGLGDAFGALGEGLAEFGDGGGEADAMFGLGTMLGLTPGGPGYREDWVATSMTDDRLSLPGGLSMPLPLAWSVLGDPPGEAEARLVFLMPGGDPALGLRVDAAAPADTRGAMFDAEAAQAIADLEADGRQVTSEDVTGVTGKGRPVRTRTLRYDVDGVPVETVMFMRTDLPALVIAVTEGHGDARAQVTALLDELVDSIAAD